MRWLWTSVSWWKYKSNSSLANIGAHFIYNKFIYYLKKFINRGTFQTLHNRIGYCDIVLSSKKSRGETITINKKIPFNTTVTDKFIPSFMAGMIFGILFILYLKLFIYIFQIFSRIWQPNSITLNAEREI